MVDKQNESPIIDASPVVKNSKSMDFPVAISEMTAGKKVTKLEWNNIKYYGYLSPITNHLTLHKDDGKDYDWIVNDGDMNGDDWVVLET